MKQKICHAKDREAWSPSKCRVTRYPVLHFEEWITDGRISNGGGRGFSNMCKVIEGKPICDAEMVATEITTSAT